MHVKRMCPQQNPKNKIPNLDSRGIFKEWAHHVRCENTWETLAEE